MVPWKGLQVPVLFPDPQCQGDWSVCDACSSQLPTGAGCFWPVCGLFRCAVSSVLSPELLVLDGVSPKLLCWEQALASSFSFCGSPNKMKRNLIHLKVLPCVGAMWLAVSVETQISLSRNKAAFISLLVTDFVGSFFCHEKAALAFIFVLAVWPPSDPKHLFAQSHASL